MMHSALCADRDIETRRRRMTQTHTHTPSMQQADLLVTWALSESLHGSAGRALQLLLTSGLSSFTSSPIPMVQYCMCRAFSSTMRREGIYLLYMYFKRIFLASATCIWLATGVGLATWPHLRLPDRSAKSGQVSSLSLSNCLRCCSQRSE